MFNYFKFRLNLVMVCSAVTVFFVIIGYWLNIMPLQQKLNQKQIQLVTVKNSFKRQEINFSTTSCKNKGMAGTCKEEVQILPQEPVRVSTVGEVTQLVQDQNQFNSSVLVDSIKQVPPQNLPQNLLDVLCDLEQAIRDSDIDSASFVMQNVQDSRFCVTYPIVIDVRTSYKNVLIFINKLLSFRRLVTFKELILRKEDLASDCLNAHFVLEFNAHKYEIVKKINLRHDLVLPVITKDIFSEPHDIFYGLNLWAIKELRFLGLVKKNEQVFGIISDPVGAIHHVVVGDSIGLKPNRIAAINDKGVFLVNSKEGILRKN